MSENPEVQKSLKGFIRNEIAHGISIAMGGFENKLHKIMNEEIEARPQAPQRPEIIAMNNQKQTTKNTQLYSIVSKFFDIAFLLLLAWFSFRM